MEEIRKVLEERSYESLLREWRHSPLASKVFVGERGKLFREVMLKKRDELSPKEQTLISKKLGW